MERAGQLIEKLYSDFKNHASPDQLLINVQLLQKELMQYTHRPDFYKASKKVAVVLPTGQQTMFTQAAAPPPAETRVAATAVVPEAPPAPATKEVFMLQTEPEQEPEPQPVMEAVPPVKATVPAQPEPQPQPVMEKPAAPQPLPVTVGVELNDIIGGGQKSLNERLKENGTAAAADVAELLTETPLKDLKKGIGLNDRYLYINDLFRGDETMYERSIKTINGFNIYPEAQYWMERELKIKLGWNDSNHVVQQFYSLVRRRFS